MLGEQGVKIPFPFRISELSEQEAQHVLRTLMDCQPGWGKDTRTCQPTRTHQPAIKMTALELGDGAQVPVPVLGGTDSRVTSDKTFPVSGCPAAPEGGF